MNELTKKYRLIWDYDNTIIGDPFEEYKNSKTLINTTNYFQTDIVEEIQPKIDEEELTYPEEEEIPEE